MTRTTIALTIVAIGWVFPIAAAIALWSAPSVVTREGDAGAFQSASVTPCGFGCDTMTSVHTSRGTFVVLGVFATALRGSPMVIRDTTAAGLELCIDTAAGSCNPLAGGYSGSLRTVAKAPWGLSHDAREDGLLVCAFWIPFGVMALIIFLTGTEADDAGGDTPADHD